MRVVADSFGSTRPAGLARLWWVIGVTGFSLDRLGKPGTTRRLYL
jgi:hypothetical protein